MKKRKALKVLATVLVLVMMLSTSVFAAENKVAAVALTDEYHRVAGSETDTLTVYYYPNDDAYMGSAEFGDITNATIDGNIPASMTALSGGTDSENMYMDFSLNNSNITIRVWACCNSFGDVYLTAEQV